MDTSHDNQQFCIKPKDRHVENANIDIYGHPGNSFDIASRKYVMAVVGGHNIDPYSHFSQFKYIEDKIDALTGTTNCSSIQIYDDYGTITNQIKADLNVLVNGVIKKLATTDDLSSISPTALPLVIKNVETLKYSVDNLHTEVSRIAETTESLLSRCSNVETKCDNIETKCNSVADTVAKFDEKLSTKQDAIYFSSDFASSDNHLNLNYGVVSEDSELPVKGKDIVKAFSTVLTSETYSKSNITVGEMLNGMLNLFSKMGANITDNNK